MFLDNLFLNVAMAYTLLTISFTIMNTTRKNATGLPLLLTALLVKDKEVKKNAKKNNRELKKKKKK